MRKYTVLLLLSGIICLGFFIRIYGSSNNFVFHHDQTDDLMELRRTWDALKTGDIASIPLRGSGTGYKAFYESPIFHGALYFYVHLPMAVVGNFHPYAVTLGGILLSTLAIWLLYLAGSWLFIPPVGLLAAFLFAVSYWMNDFARSFWPPSLVPFFALACLVGFAGVFRGKEKFFPLLAFGAAAASQMHNGGYVVLAFGLLSLLWFRLWPRSPRVMLATLVAFFVPILPTIVWEVQQGGPFFHLLEKILSVYGGGGTLTASYRGILSVVDVAHEFFLFVTTSIGVISAYHRQMYGPIFTLLAIGAFVVCVGNKFLPKVSVGRYKKSLQLLALWFIVFVPIPSLAAAYYGFDLSQGHSESIFGQIVGVPFVLLSFSILTVWLWRNRFLRFFIVAAILVMVHANVTAINEFIWHNEGGKFTFGDKVRVGHAIAQDASGQPYEIEFRNWHEPGRDILYILTMEHLPWPERLNGAEKFIGWTGREWALSGRPARIVYTLTSANGFPIEERDLLGVFGVLAVYKTVR